MKEVDENKVELIYESEREGLASMVVGLLKGLGKRFNKDCSIEQIGHRSKDGKDTFLLAGNSNMIPTELHF